MSDDPFHIWFERSGGFMGASTSVEIDSDSLSAEEAKELSSLINQCSFYEYQQDSLKTGMPDQYLYRITIEQAGERKELEFNETTVPGQFRPLLNYLMKKARKK